MPVGLTHLDSELCWCDPIVEVDEDGEHTLLHRQVTTEFQVVVSLKQRFAKNRKISRCARNDK